MRRTVRALSLAAATGAVLAVCAPAASAGSVPDAVASWGSASRAPCPEPAEHEPDDEAWEGYEPLSAVPDPLEHDADLPEGTTLDGLGSEPGLDAEPGLAEPGLAEPGFDAAIPGPEDGDTAELVEPKTVKPGPTGSKAPAPRPTGSKTPAPKPTASKGTPCATPPAHHGVHAGGGGAFTDSVPALAAGGLLIAGAFGAAAHRLHRDRTTRADG
ncbi:hypothetical protein [Streptomyces sp. NRRL WC-3626]|uniref:hypothetical protein n=1 Tax=Streptomyces sp. NRRL WC-3626 TaxID=1463926 RepID=UPI0004C2581A|nr:hypothetical protein [Streptomyces sp. NRRL WC-3626]